MLIFETLKPNYADTLKSVDVYNLTPEEQSIIENYRTPSRSYISNSARDLNSKEVDLETLEYILTKCHQCKEQERYEASLVLLNKLVVAKQTREQLESAKKELIENLSAETQKNVVDFSYIEECIKGYENSFFYLVELTIGKNTTLKYGITDKPRARFAQIKSDVKTNYSKYGISVKPLMLLHCRDNKKFEEDVSILLVENDIYQTNYKFKGSSETFSSKYLDTARALVKITAQQLAATILYPLDDESGIDDTDSEVMSTTNPIEVSAVDETQSSELTETADSDLDDWLEVALPEQKMGGLQKSYLQLSDLNKPEQNVVKKAYTETKICKDCGNPYITDCPDCI